MKAQREFHNLTDLALVLVNVRRVDVKGLRIGLLVHIMADTCVNFTKRVQLPLLPGQPHQHPALDVGQVSDAQLLALWRDDAATHRVGQRPHRLVGGEVQRTVQDGLDHQVDHPRVEVRALHVLRLEHTTGPPTSAHGTSKLQRVAQTAIG